MTMFRRVRALGRLTLFSQAPAFGLFGGSDCCIGRFFAQRNAGQNQPTTDSFDYVKRDVMIPMRDGVKLHTVIVVPKGAKNAPILLTRTPYDANAQVSHAHSPHLGPILAGL